MPFILLATEEFLGPRSFRFSARDFLKLRAGLEGCAPRVVVLLGSADGSAPLRSASDVRFTMDDLFLETIELRLPRATDLPFEICGTEFTGD